jgi:hypothetical protein
MLLERETVIEMKVCSHDLDSFIIFSKELKSFVSKHLDKLVPWE